MTSVEQIDVHFYHRWRSDEHLDIISDVTLFHADVYPHGTLFIRGGLVEGFHIIKSLYDL